MKYALCLALAAFCWCLYAGAMEFERALQDADEAADLRREAEE